MSVEIKVNHFYLDQNHSNLRSSCRIAEIDEKCTDLQIDRIVSRSNKRNSRYNYKLLENCEKCTDLQIDHFYLDQIRDNFDVAKETAQIDEKCIYLQIDHFYLDQNHIHSLLDERFCYNLINDGVICTVNWWRGKCTFVWRIIQYYSVIMFQVYPKDFKYLATLSSLILSRIATMLGIQCRMDRSFVSRYKTIRSTCNALQIATIMALAIV